MQIFFSVGEPSGDQHAAHLIQELKRRRPDLRFTGYGGPLMEQAGCRLHYRLTNLAVMGLLRIVPLLWRFYKLVRQAGRFFRESSPDAVVLVDFPGFNWWIARKAKAAGIPVYYYLPPQLWAWGPWRVKRMRKFVDHVLCGLSFEKQWYAERGISVDYVGHPFFDEVAEYRLDREFCKDWSSGEYHEIGILPGSRSHEVTRNWPVMLQVMRKLYTQHPNVRFLVACYKPSHQQYCRERLRLEQSRVERRETVEQAPACRPAVSVRQEPDLRDFDTQPLPVHFFVGKTPEIIDRAGCCLMVSGSVSLEMLARATPAVVIYMSSWFWYVMARLLLTVKSITLPNLMSERTVLPEFLIFGRPKRHVEVMSGILNGWLSDPHMLKLSADQLVEVRDHFAQTGATGRAAGVILDRLASAPAAKAA